MFRSLMAWLWRQPRPLRALLFATAWAVGSVAAGKLITLVTGFWCACWIGNARIGLVAGILAGAYLGFVYEPFPFGKPRRVSEEFAASNL